MSDEEKNFSGYREKAENYFKRNAPDNEFLRSQDKDRIIHELRVHQIELELQNEELRNTQLELERTRNEYSDLFKNAPVGYLIITDQGLIIRANNTASAYFDLPVKKIEDQFITQFIHRDSQDDFHHFRLKMISGESKTRAEITLRINNKNFYSLFEGSAIARLPREKQFYRLVISDINRIKTLERETISGRANYSAIFSMAHDPMFVISNTGIILDCNITAAALFEKSPHEFIGDNIASYFAEGSPIQLKDFLIENSGELSEADFRGSKGESIRLEISSTGIEFHEQDAVLLVCRDLRERISYHREMRELIAQKEKFFSIITHNLRSSFEGFLKNSDVLFSGFNDLTIEELEEKSKTLNESAKMLFGLLDNLLEWSTLQSGNSAFAPEIHDISELVFNTLYMHKNQLEQKKIHIANEVAVNNLVRIDYKMIVSVLQNLISNAVKFMDEEGTIRITAHKSGDMITITISDTGAGISPENLGKLFSVENHDIRSGDHRGRGSGLGLLLCREFIEKHGGRIWAESQVGEGSSFSFTLPAADDDEFPLM